MAHEESTDIRICSDCAMMAANAEGEPEHAEAMVKHLGEGVRVVVGYLDESFSWSPCQGCGSTLGGYRHFATIFWTEEKTA